ncbi:DUF4326 domain-containing protein [Sphingomonas sp. SRS2]|uniref:DUF4326 domain-containing protein n=1 Tax=Sphingomonas sp. SRS2 TaxID=133190 RepID=UPI00061846CE|nr:DUF4326 domain-containing protein [Sphingomonas sp. SRS2]KKC24879.1 hypothetical protein WP12_16765 [Sphingomonas sp. SRS2]
MVEPVRIQLSRAKGWRMPPTARKVDRSTAYGNMFNATQHMQAFGHRGYPMPCVRLRTPASLDRCLDMFVGQLMALVTLNPDFLEPLRGRDLGCWCKLCDKHAAGKPFREKCDHCAPCHADIIGIVANGTAA